MKYRDFVDWCNRRACDGCWDSKGAIACIEFIKKIDSYPFWKRNKIWKEYYEKSVIENIITPIHDKMVELKVITDEEEQYFQDYIK